MPVFQNYEPQVTPDIGQVQRVSTNGEAIGQGLQSLGSGLDEAAAGLQAYHEHIQQTADFDDQAKLRDFVQVRQNALETAKQNMPAEATGFAGNFMKDQQAAEQQFLQTISPANRTRYAASIQATNSNFLGLATDAERAGRSAFEINSVQQAFNGYQTTIRDNPGQREAAQTDLFKSIDAMTSATAQQKIEMKQKIDQGMAFQQALGEAGGDPEKMKTLVWGKQAAPVFQPPANAASLPAGMQNNNPFNLKYSNDASVPGGKQGNSAGAPGVIGPSKNTDQGTPQVVYATRQDGLNAGINLSRDKYAAGMKTPQQIIAGVNGWTHGNVSAAASIAKQMGIGLDDDMHLDDPNQMRKFTRALLIQEQGQEAASKVSDEDLNNAIADKGGSQYDVNTGDVPSGGPARGSSVSQNRPPINPQYGSRFNYATVQNMGDPRQAGWAEQNLTPISVGGQSWQVNKQAAAAFQGFLDDLKAEGYNPKSSGGYNLRNVRGSDTTLSQHAWGNAIDIGAENNAMGSTKTDLPANVRELAAKHGLVWGMDIKGRPDPMHFEWAGPGGAQGGGGASAGAPTSIAPDSRFASLTPEQRDSLVETATRNLTAQTTAANAAATQAQKSLVDNLQTAIINNQAGVSDVKPFLDRQQITPDQYLQLQGQIEKRDNDTNNDANFWKTASAGGSFNQYSETDQKGANAAFRRAGGDLAALDKIYNVSGIVPKDAMTALRGGLVSQNAQTVGSTLNIAANALSRNPNVFTGVDGGGDLEKNGLLYSHLVNDRGFSASQAVQEIMRRNTPEYKSKLPAQNVQDDFAKSITPDTIAKQFSGWLPGSTPSFGGTPDQKSEMLRDYKEIALDRFNENGGDASDAQNYAKAQVNKVWGVSNVLGTSTLVKYPIEKTYPPVNEDPAGPYNYVTTQARDKLREDAKQLVLPENIIIAPIPNVTAQAYLRGEHAPYMLGYQAPDENGYMQIHMLPGMFTPNPDEGHRLATQFITPRIDQMQDNDLRKQQDLQQEQNFNQQRWQLFNPSDASRTAPNRREWPPPAAPKIPPPAPQSQVPTSGSDAYQRTRQNFEQGFGSAGGDGWGGSGVGM